MGKIAFVFSGQGSQSVGMGLEIYKNFESAKNVFDLAGEQIQNLCFESSQDELNLTLNAQPCIFTVNLACAAALNERGIFPNGVAGFSLGEVSALAYCGLMTIEQAFDFVKFRAKTMHECSLENKGGMFAVMGLQEDIISKICDEVEGAYPANFNCKGQTVISCAEHSFEELKNKVKQYGGKAIKLATSGAFHSPFMDKAKEQIDNYLQSLSIGEMLIPIYSNVTAKIYNDPKKLIATQVNNPVLWQKTIENMMEDGFDTFVEMGSGKALSGIIKKISSDVRIFNACDLATLEDTVKLISGGIKNA